MAEFVDRVTLHLKAGDGGNGCVSVRREKFKPLAGPDGGTGGTGGDIVLVADPDTTTLLGYHRRPHRRAGNGGFGMGDNRDGASGDDLELPVPVGTVVRADDGSELADLAEAGARVIVAEGGRGGLGNAALASPKRKAPGFALLGTPGFDGDVELELKTLADVALVGFPSAGKSSLVAALSAARPKIADYPFTTLTPNLGVVQAGDVRYTVADVPGLIEGASEGRGLGLEFLRHVERCAALVHVLDCATLEPGRDPLTDLDVILTELAAYPVPAGQVPLAERPAVVALNKVDVPEAAELAALVRPDLEARGLKVIEISTASHAGLRELSFALAGLVDTARAEREAAPAALPRIVIEPRRREGSDFRVTAGTSSEGPFWRVTGGKPERWVAQTDFANDEAVGYLADRLARLGVEDALVEAGATAGATVVIGPGDGVVFDWEPTLVSAAEVLAARGSDPRLESTGRATRGERRRGYHERMDAKQAARDELAAEREAGLWREDAGRSSRAPRGDDPAGGEPDGGDPESGGCRDDGDA